MLNNNREKLIKFTSTMKGGGGRENKAPSADLLVCFPSRAHLALMPKPASSPKRPISEPNKRHPHPPPHHLKKINTRSSRAGGGGGGPASPMVWAKGDPEEAEPTSPKVTCAGQIKVRPGGSRSAGRNWQSVMEEIERIHTTRSKHTKKSKHWAEALGFKKDVMNFLTCLGNIRFDFRCFGSFPDHADVSSDEEEEPEQEQEQDDEVDDESNTVFSKWYMVLQENDENMNKIDDDQNDDPGSVKIPEVPPANALLLMRCRSAPAKRGSWLQERENVISKREAEAEAEAEERENVISKREAAAEEREKESEEEEKKEKKRESLAIVMKYDTEFYKLSSDVSQETWLVDGLQDAFSRSRSWKR